MLTTVAVSMGSTLLLVFGLAGAWALFRSVNLHHEPATNQPQTGYLEELAARLAAVELVVQGLPSLWEEERQRMLQYANRAGAAENRTRKLLAEGEDEDFDEEEAENIQQLDALRSEYGGLHTVPGGVETAVDADLQARAAAVLSRGF